MRRHIGLKTLINKFLVVKQMYFGIDVKKDSLSIRSTSSSTIKAATFMARGSSKNFNAGLAYEMKKHECNGMETLCR